jgi:uncharacterized protein (UPF0264 family)
VSVRGPIEALEAARGGALIADVEFPGSALGTPYPLNIAAVKARLKTARHIRVKVSTNIGEDQSVRGTACQAALGVAVAGADLVKFGLAGMELKDAAYLGKSIVRTVRFWRPKAGLYPAVFADTRFSTMLDTVEQGPRLAAATQADGLLVDTYDKTIGKGLLDYLSANDVKRLAAALHRQGREVWIAGSLTLDQLPSMWQAKVDVICVRGAACDQAQGDGRFGKVRATLVKELVATIPRS